MYVYCFLVRVGMLCCPCMDELLVFIVAPFSDGFAAIMFREFVTAVGLFLSTSMNRVFVSVVSFVRSLL